MSFGSSPASFAAGWCVVCRKVSPYNGRLVTERGPSQVDKSKAIEWLAKLRAQQESTWYDSWVETAGPVPRERVFGTYRKAIDAFEYSTPLPEPTPAPVPPFDIDSLFS